MMYVYKCERCGGTINTDVERQNLPCGFCHGKVELKESWGGPVNDISDMKSSKPQPEDRVGTQPERLPTKTKGSEFADWVDPMDKVKADIEQAAA